MERGLLRGLHKVEGSNLLIIHSRTWERFRVLDCSHKNSQMIHAGVLHIAVYFAGSSRSYCETRFTKGP